MEHSDICRILVDMLYGEHIAKKNNWKKDNTNEYRKR